MKTQHAELEEIDPESEAKCAAALSSSHHDAEPPYFDHLPTDLEPSYDTLALPLAEVTGAYTQSGILFPRPQALFAPASSSLELPVPMPCDTVTPLTMDSGALNFFGIADYNDGATSDPTHQAIDYHSSDHIFDNFNATFGSMEDAYQPY